MLIFAGCVKLDIPSDTPKCIQELIIEEEKSDCLKAVYSYRYNGERVFVFTYPCPTECRKVFGENCVQKVNLFDNFLCACDDSGFSCTEDFLDNRTEEVLVWENINL